MDGQAALSSSLALQRTAGRRMFSRGGLLLHINLFDKKLVGRLLLLSVAFFFSWKSLGLLSPRWTFSYFQRHLCLIKLH